LVDCRAEFGISTSFPRTKIQKYVDEFNNRMLRICGTLRGEQPEQCLNSAKNKENEIDEGDLGDCSLKKLNGEDI
jgi:hypothetical protein